MSTLSKHTKGMTLIEIILYFTLLTILSASVISSLFSLFKSYSQIRVAQDMETTAIQVLDKMTRDIHDAEDVVIAQSSFGIPESYVTLSVPNALGSSDIVKYYATSSQIKVDKNGTYLGDLSLSTADVNSFVIRFINGTSTKALKIELGLQAEVRNSSTTVIYKNFYTTVQLRD
jgi:type II secretory pathway pseudopilin PulG